MRISRRAKLSLRTIAILYLSLLLLLPIGVVLDPDVRARLRGRLELDDHAGGDQRLTLSLVIALIAVPLNTVFGKSTILTRPVIPIS